MSAAQTLRQLMTREGLTVAPGAYDGLTARLVEQAGFELVYMTGAGTAAAHGFPDYGLVTANEMSDNVAVMASATKLPLIADADTGYGNELNVIRTVRDFERAGAAAIHIEDQVTPKRCGHLDGKELITKHQFVSKIAAAVAARRNPAFVIIARTDARAVAGLDEAIARVNAALAAGADMAFVEAPTTPEEIAAIPTRVEGPCLLNIVPGGKTPLVSYEDARKMGYKLAICPGVVLRAVVPAVDSALAALKKAGLPVASGEPEPAIEETFRRFGAEEWDILQLRFGRSETEAHLKSPTGSTSASNPA